jgi:ubiquinone/menaquinone biosynthesis C-methylase UbiE
MARILDVGCGRKKFPGSIGIDMSPAGQADVLCDWTRTLPFADSSFDQVRLIHVIEEVDNIFTVLAEVHRVARPGASGDRDPALHRPRIVLQPGASLAPFQFFVLVFQR